MRRSCTWELTVAHLRDPTNELRGRTIDAGSRPAPDIGDIRTDQWQWYCNFSRLFPLSHYLLLRLFTFCPLSPSSFFSKSNAWIRYTRTCLALRPHRLSLAFLFFFFFRSNVSTMRKNKIASNICTRDTTQVKRDPCAQFHGVELS